MVTGRMLEFLMEVEKPGFGARLMASKSAQWPMEEEMPANVPAARKLKNFPELKTSRRDGAVAPRNPSKANPTINRSICLGANPLSVSHRIQRYNPTIKHADRIE
jgi:hypothetical protein